ncbi:hypothetical protein BT69DRAFT_1238492 [Atractiella rhizophila]|nr:hypothetical protein BT69DRAFT_1238492 [Atractiella rhizophila]
MSRAGIESVVIKVAGMGLDERDLGTNVCSAPFLTKMLRLNEKYGLHPCGEGGEYETFTLDSPIFKKRIVLKQTQNIITDPSPIAPVAYIRILDAVLEEKDHFTFCGCGDSPDDQSFIKNIVDIPETNAEGRLLLTSSVADQQVEATPFAISNILPRRSLSQEIHFNETPNGWIGISGIYGGSDLTLEEEIVAAFSALERALTNHGLHFNNIAHVNLYLSPDAMKDFGTMNNIYKQYFTFPSPPSRACVSVQLDEASRVLIDVVARRLAPQDSRLGLHVQSLSYWAPANIGPYSQAITAGGRVFIAGQIPLIPHVLELPSNEDFTSHAISSLLHVQSVIEAVRSNTGGGWEGWMDSCICWIRPTSNDWGPQLDIARAVWRSFSKKLSVQPTVCFVAASCLPKNAQIEWQCTYQTGVHQTQDDDHESNDVPILSTEMDDVVEWSILTSRKSFSAQASWTTDVPESSLSRYNDLKRKSFSARLFYRSDTNFELLEKFGPHVQRIPVMATASMSSSCYAISLCLGDNDS